MKKARKGLQSICVSRVYEFPGFFISRETGNFELHFPGTREFPGNAFIKYLYKEKYEKSLFF